MKVLRQIFLLILMSVIGAGAAYAYFSSQAKVKGASFSTGTAFLKIAKTGNPPSWDSDTLTGDIFNGIIPGWTNNYHIFVKNTGSTALHLTMSGNADGSETCNLSSHIMLNLEPFNNTLSNLSSLSEGIDLGIINSEEVKDIALNFSLPTTTTLTGNSACSISSYNFIFDGTAEPTIQPTATP